MSLKPLFNKHGCDKSKKHYYHLYYDKLFDRYPDPIKVLEIGVYKGDSTAAFLEYRPDCEFYGLDIFERVSIDDVKARIDGPVKLKSCNSTNATQVNKILSEWNTKFDIIIDDGSHYPADNKATAMNFSKWLAPGGTYVIEDVFPYHKMTLEEMNHPWLKRHSNEWNQFTFDSFYYWIKDNYKIENEIDLRSKSGEPDSYIIEMSK